MAKFAVLTMTEKSKEGDLQQDPEFEPSVPVERI
jgi:hypothetical protein